MVYPTSYESIGRPPMRSSHSCSSLIHIVQCHVGSAMHNYLSSCTLYFAQSCTSLRGKSLLQVCKVLQRAPPHNPSRVQDLEHL